MAPSLLHLLRRDHDELELGLRALVRPRTGELRNVLDGVRLGLTAHAEAEDIVVHTMLGGIGGARLAHVIAVRNDEHREQERALGALLRSHPATSLWRDRVLHLIALVREHRESSENVLGEALEHDVARERAARLAGAYATERMRQLAMLVPSAPILVPDELRELMQATA
jgi:hypothetical protein